MEDRNIGSEKSRQTRSRRVVSMATLAFAMAMSLARSDSAPPATASVYECFVEGNRIFSDRPCGADAKPREIGDPNRMNAQDTRILQHHEPAPARRKQSSDNELQRKRNACNRNREQVDEIHTRMRIGYRAAQGIRYEERLRKLNERYRLQQCERYR